MKKNSRIIIVFTIGLLIFSYPFISQVVNNLIYNYQIKEFEKINLTNEELERLLAEMQRYNQELYAKDDRFRDPFVESNIYESFDQYSTLYSGEIFASIEIPKISLNVPVYLGASDQILNHGIGQVEGSSLPVGGLNTHSILAGHRGLATKLMFRNIDKLTPGDLIYIHNISETLIYEVYHQQIVEPHETSSLELVHNKDLITLYTCHPYRKYDQRLLVHAERKN